MTAPTPRRRADGCTRSDPRSGRARRRRLTAVFAAAGAGPDRPPRADRNGGAEGIAGSFAGEGEIPPRAPRTRLPFPRSSPFGPAKRRSVTGPAPRSAAEASRSAMVASASRSRALAGANFRPLRARAAARHPAAPDRGPLGDVSNDDAAKPEIGTGPLVSSAIRGRPGRLRLRLRTMTARLKARAAPPPVQGPPERSLPGPRRRRRRAGGGPEGGRTPSRGRVRTAFARSSTSAHGRLTRLSDMPPAPVAFTRPCCDPDVMEPRPDRRPISPRTAAVFQAGPRDHQARTRDPAAAPTRAQVSRPAP